MMGSGRKTGEKWLKLDAVIVGLHKDEDRYEIFVDPDLAFRYRRGEDIPIESILKSYDLYEDARRGMRASEERAKEFFGTDDIFEIAAQILKRGEFKLTLEQRNQLIAEKRDAIIEHIAKRAVNPQTGHPHPPDRIRQAMQEAKVKIDPFLSVEEQVPAVVKALRAIIPISFESVKLRITIPATYSGKGYNMVAKAGLIKQETWNPDGSWTGLVEIPASHRQQLYDELNRLTKGQVQIELVK